MLQLPDAQRREQEALGAGERTHGWKISHVALPRDVLSRATPARLLGADGTCGLAYRNVPDIIHNSWEAPSGPEGEFA
jgi:hypothetical protein